MKAMAQHFIPSSLKKNVSGCRSDGNRGRVLQMTAAGYLFQIACSGPSLEVCSYTMCLPLLALGESLCQECLDTLAGHLSLPPSQRGNRAVAVFGWLPREIPDSSPLRMDHLTPGDGF